MLSTEALIADRPKTKSAGGSGGAGGMSGGGGDF
jgi:hypothetical protein